jgi:hypothetical protein
MRETYKSYNAEIVKKLDRFKILLFTLGGFDQNEVIFDFSLDTLRNSGKVEQVYIYLEVSFYFDGFTMDFTREMDNIDKRISTVLEKFNLNSKLELVKERTQNWSGVPMITKIDYNARNTDSMTVELSYYLEPNF